MTRWEVPETEWDSTKFLVRARIEETASRRQLITYSDLVQGLPHLAGPDSHAFAAMQGVIGTACRAEGEPQLTALVVHKHDQQPGAGFWALAEQLRLLTTKNELARLEFWAGQVRACHDHWGQ